MRARTRYILVGIGGAVLALGFGAWLYVIVARGGIP